MSRSPASSAARPPPSSGDAPGGAAREQRVLILAPSGNDAPLTAGFLQQAGLEAQLCRDMAELTGCIAAGCGAVVLAEETLDVRTAALLSVALATQPSWSDLPICIVTSHGEPDLLRQRRLETFGREANITLIERPFRPATLTRTVSVALRTRLRQYQVRDLWTVLKGSEARIRRLLEQTAVGLAELDLQGRFTMVNDHFCFIAGRPRAELLQLRLPDITHPEDIAMAAERREALFSGRMNAAVIEKRYRRPDGSDVWVQDHLSAIRDLAGRVCGIAVASADITDRKRAEETAGRARDEALAASRAKDDFLAALSHELRTPLNPVLLLASEGESNPDYPRAARDDFATISHNVALEARLFDDLLDLTRITHGHLLLDRHPLELHRALGDALATVGQDIAEKRIAVEREFGAAPVHVLGDFVRLQQVFWNILKNAVKFTPQEGRIAIRTWRTGADRVSVAISDTGIGLVPSEIGRIFDTFAQGDHATERGVHRFGGLGLGLAISKTLVELHGGSLTAASEGRDAGATFTIELPLVRPAGCRPAAPPAPSAAPAPAPGAPRRRVLVVEDHEPTRVALAGLLARRRFEVFTAETVAEALALLREGAFDLLLSDIGLPDGTGYDLMESLGPAPGLRAIALTGYGQEQDVALTRAAGFSAHLTKPIDVRSLDRVLGAAQREPAGR